jgi:lysophospholipase L1-like esterase
MFLYSNQKISPKACVIVLLTVLGGAGGVGILASRAVQAFQWGQRPTIAELATHIDRLSDEIRFSVAIDLGHQHNAVRQFIVRSDMAQKPNAILFAGDSITEAAFLPESICGHPVINAGLGGADIGSYLDFARLTMPSDLKSPLIVVALGTNDSTSIGAKWDNPLAPAYGRLADYLETHADRLLFAGIPPIEMSGALAKSYFDIDFSRKNDAAIRAVALSRSVDFVDLQTAIVGEHLTVDGIHLTPIAYREWLTAIVHAAEKTLGCKTAPYKTAP